MANYLKKPAVKNWEDLPLILTADETAMLLKCSINTVLKFCRSGKIRACKPEGFWIISRDMLRQYIEGGAAV